MRRKLKRVYVSEDIHKKIKIGAVMKQKPIVDFVSEIVDKEFKNTEINFKKNERKNFWKI